MKMMKYNEFWCDTLYSYFLDMMSVWQKHQKGVAVVCIFLFLSNQIQTLKRFKTTIFIRTKYNMQILGVIPFIKLQNDT